MPAATHTLPTPPASDTPTPQQSQRTSQNTTARRQQCASRHSHITTPAAAPRHPTPANKPLPTHQHPTQPLCASHHWHITVPPGFHRLMCQPPRAHSHASRTRNPNNEPIPHPHTPPTRQSMCKPALTHSRKTAASHAAFTTARYLQQGAVPPAAKQGGGIAAGHRAAPPRRCAPHPSLLATW